MVTHTSYNSLKLFLKAWYDNICLNFIYNSLKLERV